MYCKVESGISREDIQNLWSLYDTGVKNRYGHMPIKSSGNNTRSMRIIQSVASSNSCLLAIRENQFKKDTYEALVVKKELDFSMLEENGKGEITYTLYCEDVQYGDLGNGAKSYYIVVSQSSECELIT